MKKLSLFILFVAGCLSMALSQQHQPPMSSVTAPTHNVHLLQIDTLLNGYIQKGWLTGVVTLVIKDNKILQYKGYGLLDAASKKPMPKDALFRIASQTKAIVSVAIMTLYEQGKFTMDEPIGDFIPAFKTSTVLATFNEKDSSYTTVPAKRPISFHDLLTHTSGLDYPGIGTTLCIESSVYTVTRREAFACGTLK